VNPLGQVEQGCLNCGTPLALQLESLDGHRLSQSKVAYEAQQNQGRRKRFVLMVFPVLAIAAAALVVVLVNLIRILF
jgi:hypothetical protein